MDFWGAVQVLRRRWKIAIAALVASLGISVLAYTMITTTYESTGVAVLTAPADGASFSSSTRPEDLKRINPLLAFDGSLTTSAQIIRQALRDPETMTELGAGPDSGITYEVTNGDATTSGPFLFVVADSGSAATSQEMVTKVLARADRELADRQRAVDAPESTYIQANTLVKPTTAEAKIGGKMRYVGAVLVLALIVSVVGTFALDNVLMRRKRRSGDEDDGEHARLGGNGDVNPAASTDAEPEQVPNAASLGTDVTSSPEKVAPAESTSRQNTAPAASAAPALPAFVTASAAQPVPGQDVFTASSDVEKTVKIVAVSAAAAPSPRPRTTVLQAGSNGGGAGSGSNRVGSGTANGSGDRNGNGAKNSNRAKAGNGAKNGTGATNGNGKKAGSAADTSSQS